MKGINYTQITYQKSIARIEDLKGDFGGEVAFIGRSNAGKSSAMNAITNNKHLAKVSKTPGRTQQINFFKVDEHHRLVDLPGYGFARVSLELKQEWDRLIEGYLQERECLKGLFLIMDIRHPLKETDQMILRWGDSADLPIHILLTKADKLSESGAKTILLEVKESLDHQGFQATIQLFSATKSTGVDRAKKVLEEWLS